MWVVCAVCVCRAITQPPHRLNLKKVTHDAHLLQCFPEEIQVLFELGLIEGRLVFLFSQTMTSTSKPIPAYCHANLLACVYIYIVERDNLQMAHNTM